MLIPVELNSKDRVLRGSIDIPEGWTDFGLSFKNKDSDQDLGSFEKLEPEATGSTVKIYDSPDDFFSDEEMEQNQNNSLPDNAKEQKVTFARDPENPRKLQFCAVFDDVGEIEVKIKFGPNATEGIASHTLTADAAMSGFINQMAERVASIEVPGSEELPIDLDGDGIPDGSGTSDLLQARQPGSMAIPGALLSEELETDPLNLVLPINDDDDDVASQADNANTSIGAGDNDVSRLLLKRPGNLTSNTGTLTLTVSHPSAVRVFKSNGSAALSTYSVNLASPTGDLAGLANGSVPIYVEGLEAESDVTFTLTYRNAQDEVVSSDSVHMTVADVSQFALLHMLGGMQMVDGDSTKVKMRNYAVNGALQMATMTLAPIGENPPLKNRGMLSKVFWDATRNNLDVAFVKGFVDGFWVALKGEKETVVGIWEFFRNDPFGRSAAMYGAVREAIGELKDLPASEIPGLLSTIAKNITEDLYTSAENQLPWEPLTPNLSPDVLMYMKGFATGTVAEGAAVSYLGVGVATKTSTVLKGIIASCKVGRYALTSLNAVRQATLKTTHIMLRLANSEAGSVHIGAIGKFLEKTEMPISDKRATELIEELFHDKAELTTRFIQRYKDHWPGLSEERLMIRYQKCLHSLAELKDIMGTGVTDDMLEGFGLMQKKLFAADVDDVDRWLDCKALWKNLDNSQKKESLKKSLEAYKQAVASDPDAKFWIKDLDTVQTKAYRYVTQAELNMINTNGGSLPVHSSKGWFCSLDNYASAADAKNALQLPQSSGSIVARIEFDISSVKNNVRVPFDADDANKNFFEFTAKAFPDNAVTPPGGGGTQFLIDGASVPITAIVPF